MKDFLILFFFFSPYADHVCANSPDRAADQVSEQADAFQKGLAALKENRLDVAFAELTIAERERPNDARVRNFRGIVLAQLGRMPKLPPSISNRFAWIRSLKMPIAIWDFSNGPNANSNQLAQRWSAQWNSPPATLLLITTRAGTAGGAALLTGHPGIGDISRALASGRGVLRPSRDRVRHLRAW